MYMKTVELIAEADEAVRQAVRRRDGLQLVARGLRRAFSELEEIEYDTDGRPRGAEAVRRILDESPESGQEVSGIVAALRDRGWLPRSDNPSNAVRAALERLISSDPDNFGKVRPTDGNAVIYFSRKGRWRDVAPDLEDED